MIKAAHQVLEEIYRPNFGYKKGGVILNQIVPRIENQLDIFTSDLSDKVKLSNVLDAINTHFGPRTVIVVLIKNGKLGPIIFRQRTRMSYLNYKLFMRGLPEM